VTLQLKWTHSFQFAGYYAAQEQGYYRDAGLTVSIKEAQSGVDPVKEVVEGKAEYGTGSSSLLLERKAGQADGGAGSYFPTFSLCAHRTADSKHHDLTDKHIMLSHRPTNCWPTEKRRHTSRSHYPA